MKGSCGTRGVRIGFVVIFYRVQYIKTYCRGLVAPRPVLLQGSGSQLMARNSARLEMTLRLTVRCKGGMRGMGREYREIQKRDMFRNLKCHLDVTEGTSDKRTGCIAVGLRSEIRNKMGGNVDMGLTELVGPFIEYGLMTPR